jgi:regulator of sigma E protease
MSVFLLILGIVLFIGLVVAHEWGHFIAARRGGVEVEEFGIFFPPKIWGKKLKGGFEFTINALPLGGFVRMKGENDADKQPGSFGAASLGTKVKIMLAGVVMNAVVAFGLLTLLALTGMPKLIDNQYTVAGDTKVVQDVQNKGVVLVDKVVDKSPAAAAGLQKDDQILSVAGQAVTDPTQVGQISAGKAGQKVPIEIKRNNQQVTLQAQLNAENKGNGYLGIASTSGETGIELRRSTWSAPIVAGGVMGQFSGLTYKGLGSALANLFKGNTAKASEQVSGPVGIVAILNKGSTLGINFTLMIIAIISLTLALMNILPIPALDGGRLFVTLLFRALKRPLTKKREEWIHGTGFAALMVLFVLITIVDVKRFF